MHEIPTQCPFIGGTRIGPGLLAILIWLPLACREARTDKEGAALSGGTGAGAESAGVAVAEKNALEAYLAKHDPVFSWNVLAREQVREEGRPSYESILIELTSQRWLDEARVDRTIWKHRVTICRPEGAQSKTASLLIGGGSNRGEIRRPISEEVVQIAQVTGQVVCELGQVPNQPLIFDRDGVERVEDDLIAYAWTRYLDTGDPEWLPRLPMVKSAVRAMDCIQAVLAEEGEGREPLAIEDFVVAGGSKRGWTTWLTPLDPRVRSISPIVIDVLNAQTSMDHHFAAYGFFSPAVGDYVNHGIPWERDNPRYQELLRIVDPIHYRERFTLPKYILNAAGDQFFLPDSSRFYWDELEGEKYLRYVANADHSLKDSDALLGLAAWFEAQAKGYPRPRFDWSFEVDGSIRVVTDTSGPGVPLELKLWRATNPEARDFRLEEIGPVWEESPLQQVSGEVAARVKAPERGFTAYFVEARFRGPGEAPFIFSSGVRVVPDTLPHLGKIPQKPTALGQ